MAGVIVTKEGKKMDGTKGGLFIGDRHKNPSGGIKVITEDGSTALVEDSEPIIIPSAVNNPKKKSFDGKKMTAKEILDQINTSYGGVNIKKKGGYIKRDGVSLSRGGGIKTIGHSGKKIEFVDSNPSATYKALVKWLDSKGIKYDYNFARTTSSRYITFTDKDGNEFEIRISTHTPALSDLSEHVGFKANSTDSFNIDSSFGYKASDIENIIELVPKVKKELYSNESINNAKSSFEFIHDFISSYGRKSMLSNFMAENNIINDKYGVSDSLLKAIFSEIRFTNEYKLFKESKDKLREDLSKLEIKYYTASNGVIIDTKNKKDSIIWDFDYTNIPNTFGSTAKKYREQLRDFARAELKELIKENKIKERGGNINDYELNSALSILKTTHVPHLFTEAKESNQIGLIKYIAEQGQGLHSEQKDSLYDATCRSFGKRLTDASIKAFPIEYEEGGSIKKKVLLAPNGKPTNLTPEQYELTRSDAFKKFFGDFEKAYEHDDYENCSKVIDSNGDPLVVYHGSPYGDIHVFDINKSNRISSGLKEYGSFFTTNILTAEFYATKTSLTKSKIEEINAEIARIDNEMDEARTSREYDKLIQKWNELYRQKKRTVYPVFLNLRKIKTFNALGLPNKDGYDKLTVNAGYKWATGGDAIEFLRDGRFGVEKVDGIRADNVLEISQKTEGSDKYLGTSFLVFNNTPQYIKLADGTNTTFDPNNPDIRFNKGGKLELLAPNGKPSNLTTEQYRLVRTDAFKNWFGRWDTDPENSSKVVDENGEPLVCWHGTRDKRFTIFDESRFGERSKSPNSKAFFFTPDKWYAEAYSETRNNKTIRVFKKMFGYMPSAVEPRPHAKEIPFFLNIKKPNYAEDSLISTIETSKKYGYDGLIVQHETSDKIFEIAAFDNKQMKLSDGTNTTFDGSNPDIRYINGGLIPQQGTLYTRDKAKKLEYEKKGEKEFSFRVYDIEKFPVNSYYRNKHNEIENGNATLNYNDFITYLNENKFIDNSTMEKGGKIVKSGYGSIDEILELAEPLIEEMVKQRIDYMIAHDKRISDHEADYIRLDLTYDLTKALGNYLQKGDKVIEPDFGKEKGVIILYAFVERDGKKYKFLTQMIIAEGVVQTRHYRYLVNTDLPRNGTNLATKNIEDKIKVKKKREKDIEEIKLLESYIIKIENKIEENRKNINIRESLSDEKAFKLGKESYLNLFSESFESLKKREAPIVMYEYSNKEDFENYKKEIKEEIIKKEKDTSRLKNEIRFQTADIKKMKSKIEKLKQESGIFKSGGTINENIILCKNCGWIWDKSDSEEKDAYICHACGCENSKNK